MPQYSEKNYSWNYVYPGDDYFYITCDICEKKIRRKDARQITDKWNRKRNLMVCHEDFDKTNEQDIPIHVREHPLPNPSTNRSEPMPIWYNNKTNTRVPSAPQFLQLIPLGLGQIGANLWWQAPNDGGSDSISGYVIYVSVPQTSTPIILNANTGNNNTVYNDTTAVASLATTYQVAAINSAGIGPMSNLAYWPNQQVDGSQTFIVTEDGKALTDELGNYIIL